MYYLRVGIHNNNIQTSFPYSTHITTLHEARTYCMQLILTYTGACIYYYCLPNMMCPVSVRKQFSIMQV